MQKSNLVSILNSASCGRLVFENLGLRAVRRGEFDLVGVPCRTEDENKVGFEFRIMRNGENFFWRVSALCGMDGF